MAEQAPILILLVPLFGALLTILLGARWRNLCVPISVIALAASSAAAFTTLANVVADGEVRYRLGGWAPPWGIELRIDAIGALVICTITVIALLNAIFSATRVRLETKEVEPLYYALSLLLAAGLCGMTLTNDAFNLYVLLEVCSLTSYALIAIGNRRATLAAFNYVIMGTIGASFYLLGVGYLYIKTGSLNMEDIHSIMVAGDGAIAETASIRVGFILIMLGVWIKMAFFPLHGWLPNAYAYSPTATGTFMAPLMTKVMVYIMVRMMLTVFGVEYVFKSLGWSHLIVWLAIIAIVAGSIFALARDDIKKMLTYLIVAEVGYMVGGAWLANEWGMVGAIYHILSDAVMTFCLFLAASIVVIRTGEPRLTAFRGLFKKMPLTMIAFTVGALSMIGLPPTCGFFSKFYLVRGGIEAGQYAYVGALIFSSLVNAVLFFRIFEYAFFDKLKPEYQVAADGDSKPDATMAKVPISMLFPLYVSAALILVVGLSNNQIVQWIQTALRAANF